MENRVFFSGKGEKGSQDRSKKERRYRFKMEKDRLFNCHNVVFMSRHFSNRRAIFYMDFARVEGFHLQEKPLDIL